MPLTSTRRRLCAGLAATTISLATAASLGAVSVGSAEAAEPPVGSPLVLRAPTNVSTVSYGGYVYSNFGIRLEAPTAPFEVWSTRASYDDPIVTEWRTTGYEAELPPGTVTNFQGLEDFMKVVVRKKSDDSLVSRTVSTTCLNSYSSQRVHPEAPARSPYPTGCPWNPFTLGSVMGVQQGWAAPVTEEWEAAYRMAPGRYVVTASIQPEWRTAFGISDEDAVRVVNVLVEKGNRRAAAPSDAGTTLEPAAQEPSGESAGLVVGPTPDLRSLPAFAVGLAKQGTVMRFAATTWNAGNSPLVVDGFRSEDEDHMDAYQYFFDTDGNQTGYQQVGEMHWHEANHQHWHFEDFARYRLLSSDMTEVVKSTKQSWCLANTDAVDYTVDGADWQPENTDLSTACGGHDALSIREVLAAGSGDTYFQYRAGQAFRVGDLPNGVYYISVEANPMGNLVETDTLNNDSLRKVKIGGRGDDRWVKTFPVGLIDDTTGGFFRHTTGSFGA